MYGSRKKFKKVLFRLVLIFTIGAIPVIAYSQITVAKKAWTGNPSAYFQGVAGNPALSKQISSDLKNCGWFSMTRGKSANYVISGSANSTAVVLTVSGSSGRFSVQGKVDPRNIAMSSHRIVDQVLKKLFNINGICATRLAFCVEAKRGVKEVYYSDFDTHNFVRVTRRGELCVEPDWTPGAGSIVYTMYSRGYTDIVETDIIRNCSRRLAQFKGLNAGGAVSPNGRYLAMILSRDNRVELYVKAIGSRGIKRLTNDRAVEASPCWSPGGSQLCYVSDRSGRPNLYIISVNRGNVRRLSTVGSEAVSPDWSTDNKIVYSAKVGPNYQIAMLDLTGKEPAQMLTSIAGDWECPSWAPDNRHIVCSRTYGGKSFLYKIDTWTKKAKRLPLSGVNLTMPSWSGIIRK